MAKQSKGCDAKPRVLTDFIRMIAGCITINANDSYYSSIRLSDAFFVKREETDMRKNNSKKWIKIMTITAAVLVFGIGAGFAVKAAGTSNSDNDGAKTVVAAANDATDSVVKETVAEKETEADTETATVATEATTEITTEEATEAVTEQSSTIAETQPQTEAVQATEQTEVATEAPAPVVQTPSDARVTQVIAGINAERAAAGVAAVTYDATLTDMSQVRASENAANDYFVIENGKHKRPDGRNASSICSDFGQAGYFGEVMGRYQTSPAEIVTGWHNSATHYACMTSTKYSRVGVGVAADSEGYLYWVAIFMD